MLDAMAIVGLCQSTDKQRIHLKLRSRQLEINLDCVMSYNWSSRCVLCNYILQLLHLLVGKEMDVVMIIDDMVK